jgi:CyaY protein
MARPAAFFTMNRDFNMPGIVMTDLEYLDLAENALQRIEAACDSINETTDVDVDNQRNASMVTLTFANGRQIVVNLQKPLQEIWLAARAGGFHYRYEDGRWRDTKGEGELFAQLSRCASEESGRALSF